MVALRGQIELELERRKRIAGPWPPNGHHDYGTGAR